MTCYKAWFKKMDSISYIYISWTIHDTWMTYITFEREGPKFSNTTARALAWRTALQQRQLRAQRLLCSTLRSSGRPRVSEENLSRNQESFERSPHKWTRRASIELGNTANDCMTCVDALFTLQSSPPFWITLYFTRTAQKKFPISIINTRQLILHRAEVANCSETHKTYINALYGQNVKLFNVQRVRTQSNHWALKC